MIKSRLKSTVMPALGVGAGLVGSPKLAGIHPVLGKYPELAPVILLVLAVFLMKMDKIRGFALGLGAVALVFLVMALYNRVSGKLGAKAEAPTDPVTGKRLIQDIFGGWGLPDVYSDPYGKGGI